MRAIVYDRPGGSDVLRLEDRESADPGPGEIRVRIVVAGVNPTDWKRRAGGSGAGTGEVVPGQDGAGVVDALGPGVSAPPVGARVWVFLAQHDRPTGTAQELAVLPADRVVPLPDDASFDLGASLGVPALTAHRALTVGEDGPDRLRPGALARRTVLVTGGAGAVGHAATQLARWAGARVLSTVSGPEKAELARAAGADHVVDYRHDDAPLRIRELAPDGVDTVVDVDLVRNVDTVARVLRTAGTVASYAESAPEAALPMRAFMGLNARLQFVLLYTIPSAALRRGVEDIAAAVAEGALPVGAASGLPLARFPLDATAAAQDAVERGAVGKVLIDVDPTG